MADTTALPTTTIPRGNLTLLLLLLLTIFTGVIALDHANEAVVRWRYERYYNAEWHAQSYGPSDLPKEQKERAGELAREMWKQHAAAFRARGLRNFYDSQK